MAELKQIIASGAFMVRHKPVIVKVCGCDPVSDASILNLQPFKVSYLPIFYFQNINCMHTFL
jgi:hypothetical protein